MSYQYISSKVLVERRFVLQKWVVWRKALVSIALVGLVLVLGYPSPSVAQDQVGDQYCDEDLKPVTGDSAYQERDEDHRCEGLYASKVAGAFDIVSFMIGKLDFDLEEGIILDVSSPDSALSDVNARARGIPFRLYYRMDGPVPVAWPVDDVLLPNKINDKKIGIYGWVQRDTLIYVPLRVVQRDRSAGTDTTVVLRLRPTARLESVRWRSAPVVNGKCSMPTSKQWHRVYNPRFGLDKKISRYGRGDVVSIVLSGIEKGEVCIKIRAKEQGSRTYNVKRNLRVIKRDAL